LIFKKNKPKKYFFLFEKRKRFKKPLGIILFAFFYISFFLINFAFISLESRIPLAYWDTILENYTITEFIYSILAFITGISIISLTKIGRIVFLFLVPVLIIYKIIIFITESSIYNFNTVFQAFFAFVTIIYFTSKDIFKPFVDSNFRGWRNYLRRSLKIQIKLGYLKAVTKNISCTGCLISLKNPSFVINREVIVDFNINRNKYSLMGGITRIDESGVAIGYRHLKKTIKKQLYIELQQYEKKLLEKKTKTMAEL